MWFILDRNPFPYIFDDKGVSLRQTEDKGIKFSTSILAKLWEMTYQLEVLSFSLSILVYFAVLGMECKGLCVFGRCFMMELVVKRISSKNVSHKQILMFWMMCSFGGKRPIVCFYVMVGMPNLHRKWQDWSWLAKCEFVTTSTLYS